MKWFRRKKVAIESSEIQKVSMDFRTYEPKIVLAWIKSLEGHAEITNWLLNNGFKELTVFNQALYLKDEARDWLIKNRFPHLMAFINAMEGNKKAQEWLRMHGLDDYFYMALAIDGEMDGWNWLKINQAQELFALATILKNIKDKIEEAHNDIHRFGKD
jgi:hypothetical protein